MEKLKFADELIKSKNTSVLIGFNSFISGYTKQGGDYLIGYKLAEKMAN